MKQLLILSGKGGTGKTTIASAFIKLSEAGACADCDVDAPNLHLVMAQTVEPKRSDYYGLPKAVIDPEQCVSCDQCRKNCRFEAISAEPVYQIDPFACEGCGVCEAICPANAIAMKETVAGDLTLFPDVKRIFSTAQLKMGSGNSGKLVTEVKKQMKKAVAACELAIIDGSPGIGCPVIASLSGVDMVLIVAEPSLSGISDMERIIRTAQNFGTLLAICVNKYDTNIEHTGKIERFCQGKGIPFAGKIPFDRYAVEAVNDGKTIAEFDCPAGKAVKRVFLRTMDLLFK